MRNQRISLRNVGEHLGLNESTVSRALRSDPRIPLQTRKRVEEACDRLGYRPNSLISELAAARWRVGKASKGTSIAYIDRRPSAVVGAGGMEVFIREQATRLGYELSVFPLHQFSNSAQLQRVLRNRGITDVILGAAFDERRLDLDWEKLICVQLMPGHFPLPLHSVVRDQFSAVVLAWEKAVSRGYERIGIVLLDHTVRLMDDVVRLSAAKACQQELYSHLPALPIFRYTYADHRESQFARWVRAVRPEVIVGFSGSHRVIYWTKFGRQIPYISLHSAGPPVSGILGDEAQSAREAVNLLHFCRRTHQWGIPEKRIDHVMEPSWFEGSTLPMRERRKRAA